MRNVDNKTFDNKRSNVLTTAAISTSTTAVTAVLALEKVSQ
ncbi:hypothetical protein [Photobacterium phosphoreum]|nr:hypothetical protein [Photobacterium phosphoreum]